MMKQNKHLHCDKLHAISKFVRVLCVCLPVLLSTACAQVEVPDGRSVNVPTVTPPHDRYAGINEKRDAVTRVKLGKDVLVPQPMREDPLPDEIVGPFELRGETLASALQLILDDYDVSIAFQSDQAMTTRITVANLRGTLSDVIDRACELANLYCHYESGTLTVKETETFVVDLPPLAVAATGVNGATAATYDDLVSGLEAIIGTAPTVDASTRVMIYTASQRAHKYALKYFERLRKNTALIIYETHIWEVALNNGNRTGINWEALFNNVGNLNLDVNLPGGAPTGSSDPISITPTYTGSGNITSSMVFEFISEQGAVKTVSQPQLTVLSGSSANLSIEQSENYVSGVTRTPSTTPGVADSVSTTTDTVETGLTMSVASAWDQATVYGTIGIQLNELLKIDEFTPDENTTIQLPQTTTRSISTQIRVRPGDAVLIAGLVTEKDDYSSSGPGFLTPMLQTARNAVTKNTELVFLLRPRVIAFEAGNEDDTVNVVDAPPQQKRPTTYAPSDITGDVGTLFDAAAVTPPASENEAMPIKGTTGEVQMLPEVTDSNDEPAYQPEQMPRLPVPASAMAPISLTDGPQDETPEKQPQTNAQTPSGLPSWLPSQSKRQNSGGASP